MSTKTNGKLLNVDSNGRNTLAPFKSEGLSFLYRPAIFWGLSGTFVFLAALSRLFFLDDKPFHHDESLHAYYSQKVSAGGVHEYSALLHGPFLYYFVGGFMALFGVGDLQARLPAALFGIFIVASPLLARKIVGPAVTLALMFFLLISPTTLYFARFLREDVFTSMWVIGTLLGAALYWKTRKEWAAYFATAMLAFHFTNKENSYLHTFLWLLGLCVIAVLSRYVKPLREMPPPEAAPPNQETETPHQSSRIAIALTCFTVFAVIYVIFYSSFFRHSKGSLHGVLDGLYRESLVYWWDQNQKRRIDGPFDFYLPILSNYEFLLFPFLALAWMRLVSLTKKSQVVFRKLSVFPPLRPRYLVATVTFVVAIALATLLIPRIAFVKDACTYTALCPSFLNEEGKHVVSSLAKALHVSHSRHVLQVLFYVVSGGVAFLAALNLRKKADAFLWFWLTGAMGIYSHVGEKVPWLTVYMLIPIQMIAALEAGRLLMRTEVPLSFSGPDLRPLENMHYTRFSKLWKWPLVLWLVATIPFTVYKAWRVSFQRAADPRERLVFTQTTNEAHKVRERWKTLLKNGSAQNIRVTMAGEATWPFAWYIYGMKEYNFEKPKPELAKNFDVILLDQTLLEDAKTEYPDFDIFSLPLRAWWVPGPNPTIGQIMGYFWTGEPYSKDPETTDSTDAGMGDAKVLYLERAGADSPFHRAGRPEFLTLLHSSAGKALN